MRRNAPLLLSSLAVPALTLLACGTPAPGDEPAPSQDLARRARAVFGQLQTQPPTTGDLEYQLFDLEGAAVEGDVTAASCDAVDAELAELCGELYQEGKVGSCGYTTSFFYAHVTPRCAVRFETWPVEGNGALHPVHTLDFSGTPLEGPVPGCGNGVLDTNEMCDDGNHESWDGCDANCNQEEFQGCERVIEDLFRQANVATIDADEWAGPRSHLMVHHDARSLTPVNQATCDAALTTAQEVCNELTQAMPFVSWCQPEALFHEEGGAPACSVRLQVWFHQLDANFGVFSTSLPGLLAFTLR